MRRLGLLLLSLLLLTVLGCQRQHELNKQQALARWQGARAELATQLARQQFESGESEKALVSISEVVSMAESYVPARLLQGQIYLELNQPVRARSCFEQCLEYEGDHGEALYSLGLIHERWGQLELAYDYYEQASASRPEHVPYILAMVESGISLGRYEQTLSRLEGHMVRSGREASLCLAAGSILAHLGRESEALSMYRKANILDGEDETIMEMLAYSLYRGGEYGEALGLFETLYSLRGDVGGESGKATLLVVMGDCQLNLGRLHEARRSIESASGYEPNKVRVWVLKGQLELSRKDWSAAAKCAKKAWSLSSGESGESMMILGYASLRGGDYAGAHRSFERLIELEGESVLSLCLLGQALDGLGDREGAADCYRRATARWPDDDLARELLASVSGQGVDGQVIVSQ